MEPKRKCFAMISGSRAWRKWVKRIERHLRAILILAVGWL